MDERIEFAQFFRWQILVYKLIGYDFLLTIKTKWHRLLLYAYMGALIVEHLYCRVYLFQNFAHLISVADYYTLVRVIGYLTYPLDSNIKFATLAVHRKQLRAIYVELQHIYPATLAAQRQYRVTEYYWSKAVLIVLVFFGFGLPLVMFCPLIETACQYARAVRSVGFAAAKWSYLKPFPMSYTFSHATPRGYAVAYVLDVVNGVFTTTSNFGTDLWIIAYTMQLCMHLEYIGTVLEAYEPSGHTVQQDCEFLAQLVRKHQRIYRLQDELNAIFGLPLIFSLLSTAASLCMLLAAATLQGLAWESFSYTSFVGSVIVQLFLVCYYGEQLISLSQAVAMAAYKSEWYNGSTRYKQTLRFIMLRSQKQAELSAQGFQRISLPTFQMVMGATYRVFALVRTMLQK